MNNQKTVAIAMSGGVDSSVAAALLLKQGYKVIGITMRLWMDERTSEAAAQAHSTENDAAQVAKILGIEHHLVDFKTIFRATVVENFLQEYQAGRTPNPCVYCNKKIKFGALYEKAKALGADYLATGHYVRVLKDEEDYQRIAQATCKGKDQSYVLYHLQQDILKHVLFPLGTLDKAQVRAMAAELKLPVFAKGESQEICFIPDDDHHRFLKEFSRQQEKPGQVVDIQGKILGKHLGISHYTIGQRKGLGIAAPTPLYVIKIDAARNEVVLGTAEESLCQGLIAEDTVFSDGKPLIFKQELTVKIRYNAKPVPALVEPTSVEGEVLVTFLEPQRAPAPGQAVVFYRQEYCLGGGSILRGISVACN
ncbi:MAG: tRNA 2-thiouridine(34) synthase MnmA [Acidaminococcaceae bacterium]